MKVVKPLSLGTLTRSYLIGGERRFVVSALGFFSLGVPVKRFAMENERWPIALQALAELGISEPLDEVLPKPRGEVLVAGSAYAQNGESVRHMEVTLSVAGIEKTLDVYGDRAWRYAPWLRIDEPRPFASMPLSYSKAFGGAHHPGNPSGRGYERNRLAALIGANTRQMPNIELAGEPVRRHWVRYAPAGFGPLAFNWQPRAGYAGRYGSDWLAHEAPGFSSSAAPQLFQRAPADQWLAGHLQGGEPYRLTGMHPTRRVIEGQLPPLRARAFIQRAGATAIEPITLGFDTVWFFPDFLLGLAVYHGETIHAHPLAFDIEGVMVAYEHRDRPRSLEHYADVYARRTDPIVGGAHLFNESELAADFDPSTQAASAQAAAARTAADMAARDTRLDAQWADFHAASGVRPPPRPRRPNAHSPLPVPDPAAVAACDFDLAPTLAGAQALIAQARAGADALQAALLATTALPGESDLGARREAALARASKPAYDLASAGCAASTGAATLTMQPTAGTSACTGSGGVEAALTAYAAQQRAARRARLSYTDPDGPLPLDVARWLGKQTEQWHRAAVLLAGRDLAGIDLSGFDFTGADLREVQLENADLRNACFVGARLDRAVLTGARLDGANFSRASLREANLSHSSGTRIRFTGADLGKAWAFDAHWPAADLSDARLDGCLAAGIELTKAQLRRVSAVAATFLNARAEASDWRAAKLIKTILMRADLGSATFAEATLSQVVLMDAHLARASFEGAVLVDVVAGGRDADWTAVRAARARAEHCNWQQATLRASDWRGATLYACDFGRADLSHAQLSDSNMSGCSLIAATLQAAHAERINLFRALCRTTNFTNASLAGASLYQTDTSDAVFTGSDLRGIRVEAGRRAIL